MKIQVLGCSGGLGGPHGRTTSYRADNDVLIDAGTGVGDLPLDQLCQIDHVFITHSHLDHVACLPLLVDSVWERRQGPITVYGLAETLAALRTHIFNWALWPDFSVIPSETCPALRFQTVVPGEVVALPGGRSVRPLPAVHTVPAVGYLLRAPSGRCWAFTGDTGPCPELWAALNQEKGLGHLVVETAFPNQKSHLVQAAQHLSPTLLADELAQLTVTPQVYVAHLKPGSALETRADLMQCSCPLSLLEVGQVFEL